MVVVVVGRWLLSLSLVVIFVAGYRCCWLCTSLSQAALSLSLLSAGSDVGWCRLRVLSLARQRWVPTVGPGGVLGGGSDGGIVCVGCDIVIFVAGCRCGICRCCWFLLLVVVAGVKRLIESNMTLCFKLCTVLGFAAPSWI